MEKINRRKKMPKEGNVWVYIALIALPVLQFILFYVVVYFNSIKMAFQKMDPVTYEVIGFTFDHFKTSIDFIFSQDGWNVIKMSILGWVSHIAVGVPLGLLFSYYIYKKRFMSGAFRIFLFLPSIIPAIILVTIYRYAMDNAIPAFQQYINSLPQRPLGFVANPETQVLAILAYNVFIGFGTSVLMYSNKMSSIEPSLSEAAKLDGTTAFGEFWHVTLPMTYSTISVFLVSSVASIFLNQLNLFSFYGWDPPAGMKTLGYYFFYKASDATTYNDLPAFCQLSAMGLVMTCIAIPLTFVVKYLLKKFGPSEE